MSASEQQRRWSEEEKKGAGGREMEELPLQSSPYIKYSDLEDYKRRGYGTEGHLPVTDTARGAGATDAPTLSGSTISEHQGKAIARQSNV